MVLRTGPFFFRQKLHEIFQVSKIQKELCQTASSPLLSLTVKRMSGSVLAQRQRRLKTSVPASSIKAVFERQKCGKANWDGNVSVGDAQPACAAPCRSPTRGWFGHSRTGSPTSALPPKITFLQDQMREQGFFPKHRTQGKENKTRI